MEANNNFRNIQFTGKGLEYFQICIVNFFLSIITLGIYSAWATVRTKKYIYGHTNVDGHAFQFHATPMQILKGRLIAIVFFVAYLVCTSFSPILSLVMILVVLCLMPWAIVQSLKFKSQMTSYRNVRFNFTGTKKDAFLVFLLYPFLAFFTLYLALPWLLKKQNEFLLANRKYGNQTFSTHFQTSVFYRVCGIVLLSSLLPLIVIATMGMLSVSAELALVYLLILVANPVAIFLVFIVIFLLGAITKTIYTALIWKHITNNTQIKNVATFTSDITVLGLIGLNVTNFIAFVCTLGLAGPWVAIRSMRYFSTHTQYKIEPEIENVIGEVLKKSSALGTEASDLFDIDVGGAVI